MTGDRRRRSPVGGVLAACLAMAMFGLSGAVFFALAVVGIAALVAGAGLSARRARTDVARASRRTPAVPPKSCVTVRHLGATRPVRDV